MNIQIKYLPILAIILFCGCTIEYTPDIPLQPATAEMAAEITPQALKIAENLDQGRYDEVISTASPFSQKSHLRDSVMNIRPKIIGNVIQRRVLNIQYVNTWSAIAGDYAVVTFGITNDSTVADDSKYITETMYLHKIDDQWHLIDDQYGAGKTF